MTTGKRRRVEATGPMEARAVAMEVAVTVAAKSALWMARAVARATGVVAVRRALFTAGSAIDHVERMDHKGRSNVPGYGDEGWRGEEQACKRCDRLVSSSVPSSLTHICPCATLCSMVCVCVLCEGVPG